MQILVIDDDPTVADLIARALARAEHTVDCAHDGRRGLELAARASYDAIVLDLAMPDIHGLDVLRDLRRRGYLTPVLILTGAGTSADASRAIEDGADDFMFKPFHAEELEARIRALARRRTRAAPDRLQLGDISFDRTSRTLNSPDARVRLTPREASLLETLGKPPGRIVSRDVILGRVWGIRFDPRSNIVDVHVARLRRKLRRAGSTAKVATVRGEGFRLLTADRGDQHG